MIKSTVNEILKEIFYSAIEAVNPYKAVENYTEYIRSRYERENYDKLLLIGFGKAAPSMALALENNLPQLITTGIIITKYGHGNNQLSESNRKRTNIKVWEAGHPIPDQNGFKATEEIIRLVKDTNGRTFIVCLISGGGSTLFVSPYNGLSLNEKQRVTDMLLKAGAPIDELNTVRKHISKVKGGRFAEIVYPARVLTLILSDVIGDKLDVIASGPTSPDRTRFKDAINVLRKYDLIENTPPAIMKVLRSGLEGSIPETPKEGNKIFESVENIIIGSNMKALTSARVRAEHLGFSIEEQSSDLHGEARDIGRFLAQKAKMVKNLKKSERPVCILSGGETTVTVKGKGKGGRNMELALSFSMEIENIDGVSLLSAGTDGTDGPTDAAGAIVDGETIRQAKKMGLAPEEYLENNDSYTFFKEIGELFVTGPTKTNVMDLQIILIK